MVDRLIPSVELNRTKTPNTSSAETAVLCVDALGFEGVAKDDAFEDIIREVAVSALEVSSHFSALVVDTCHHWSVRDTNRYTGPFNKTLNSKVLIIGNTADV